MATPQRPSRPRRPSAPKKVVPEFDNDDLGDILGDDFMDSPTPPRKSTRRATQSQQVDEDEPFSRIPLDEALDYDDKEPQQADVDLSQMGQGRISESQRRAQRFDNVHSSELAKDTYEYYNEELSPAERRARKPVKQELDTEYDDNDRPLRVDKKKRRLLPFGSKKGDNEEQKRRALKESVFDKRKNLKKQAIAVQAVVILTLLTVLGLAVKQTIFPPHALGEDEVAAIAKQATGKTNFPVERANAFAKEFMSVYLSVDGQGGGNADVLGFFYTGEIKNFESRGFSVSSGLTQKVVAGPEVYETKVLGDTSAKVLVGTLVENNVEGLTEEQIKKARSDGPNKHWVFFNVNVYYQKETDRMFIGADSPSLVANPGVGQITEIPTGMNPTGKTVGGDNKTLAKEISSTVFGYLNGYAKSTMKDHSHVDQYVIPNNDSPSQLYSGLGGLYQPKGGEASKSTTITAFLPDGNNGDKEAQNATVALAKVDVVWEKSFDGPEGKTLQANYTSTYSVVLEKSSGKWLIKSFTPYPYIPAPKGEQ